MRAIAWKTAIDALDPTTNKYKLRASMRGIARPLELRKKLGGVVELVVPKGNP